MVVFRFHPKNGVDRLSNGRMYTKVFKLLHEKGRCGVLEKHSDAVKDCHLVPVASSEPIPPQLLPFCGPGFEQNRRDVLLGVMWRKKCRERPAEDERLWTRGSGGRARASTSPIDVEPAFFPPQNSIRAPMWHDVHERDHFLGPHFDHHHHHHARPRWSRGPHDNDPIQWHDPADGIENETGKY